MSTIFTILPLYPDPAYRYNINLEGQSYTFEFSLNERQGIYHFNILNDDNQPIYEGLPLVPSEYSRHPFPKGGVLALVPNEKAKPFDRVPYSQVPDLYTFMFLEA